MSTASELREKAEAIANATPAPTVGLARLREAFPAEQVGKLPRITCRKCSDSNSRVCEDHKKAECAECGNWITTRHMHLDYVGHGAVTHRLLEVDPSWDWQPLSMTDAGLPLFTLDGKGCPIAFWIRLTICGVTRLGCGTCPSGQFDAEKVLIGDALRNAAMRFGVALDLWIKGHSEDDEKTTATSTTAAPSREREVDPGKVARDVAGARIKALTEPQRAEVKQFCTDNGMPTVPAKWTDDELGAVRAFVQALEAAPANPGTDTPPGPAEAVTGDPEAGSGDRDCACGEPAVIITLDGEAFCVEHAPAS